jgi:hypothetical protein
MNWYKKAALNPWSIFDNVPRGEFPFYRVNEERLESFIDDVTNFQLRKSLGAIVYENKFYFNLFRGESHSDLSDEEYLDSVMSLTKSLRSMGVFTKIATVPDGSYANTFMKVVLEVDPKYKFAESVY